MFTGLPVDPGLAGKKLHLFYDGDGELSYGHVTVISEAPGHDEIQLRNIVGVGEDRNVTITWIRSNPNNPLRNIRLLPPGGICASNPLATVPGSGECAKNDFKSFQQFHRTILFNPSFLSNIKSYKSIRFMDWMHTNDSSQSRFTDRPLPSHQFWWAETSFPKNPLTEKGVPLEVMVALANLMDFDPWFNIPHLATDDYAGKFAAILNAQLEPGRRATTSIPTRYGTASSAKRLLLRSRVRSRDWIYLTMDKPTPQSAWCVFTPNAPNAYSRSSRTSWAAPVASVARCPPKRWFLFHAGILSFGNAAQKTDMFAIAPYFGDTITDTKRRNALVALGVDGVFDWLLNDNNAVLKRGSLPSIDREVQDQAAVLAEFGIPLTSYEGGQHFLAAGTVSNDTQLNALMDAVNRDPRMKAVYLRYLNNWRNRTNEVFHHFVNCDRWSQFGRWGAKEFPSQRRVDAPKYDALMTL